MKILIAEDDPISRRVLQSTLAKWGYDVIVTCDGVEAWRVLQSEDAPKLAVLDWMMPEIDGVQVCQKVRELDSLQPTYIILLTAKSQKEHIVEGLQAGADDYVIKPFHREELGARIQVGVRMVELQKSLADNVRKLQDALIQIHQAQKLKSIGQLAAGIAHEINTPIQYVGDNIRFFQESFEEMSGLLEKCQQLQKMKKSASISAKLVAEMEKAMDEADMEFLLEEIPLAIEQSLEGVSRVAEIVHSMKQFSHPGVEQKVAVDINKTIESTVIIARSEWKYLAELEMNFDPNLPMVLCLPSEINQAILNLLINATHAIADVVGDGSESKGIITISTRSDGDWIEIRISDTGTGIPEEIRTRIFDPFFTTKDVGKGTGQGLAISHNIVVEKHGGAITFETEVGSGTTFIIRLPIHLI